MSWFIFVAKSQYQGGSGDEECLGCQSIEVNMKVEERGEDWLATLIAKTIKIEIVRWKKRVLQLKEVS